MSSIKYIFYAVRAYLWNRYVEFRNERLARKKRRWTAHKIGGGGVVPLGKVSRDTAVSKVSQYGSIVFVDDECALVMYDEKQ